MSGLNKLPTARQQKDEELKTMILRVWDDNFQAYGARKIWLELNRFGIPVARYTIERLMRDVGIRGIHRSKTCRTTIADDSYSLPGDKVNRDFALTAPNHLWVADITDVPTWSGWIYVAFVTDAYARRILGWRVAKSMTTDLVLDA